jgi:hypothetical protein
LLLLWLMLLVLVVRLLLLLPGLFLFSRGGKYKRAEEQLSMFQR